MFEIKVKITWRMLQTRVSQICYVCVPIYNDGSVNSMFGFARINEINMLKLYLNSRPRQGNSFHMELTWFPSNSRENYTSITSKWSI